MARVPAFRTRSALKQIRSALGPRPFFAAALGTVFLFISPGVVAQNLTKVISFDIKPQPLDKALLEFGREAHVQIMFATKTAAGRKQTQEIKGLFTGTQALTILLQRTGLTYTKHKKSIEVIPVRSTTAGTPPRTISAKDKDSADKLDAADPPRPRSNKRIPRNESLQEVVITGSRLPTTEKFTPQEVQIYSQNQIDQSGQTSIANFLTTIPSVSVNATNAGVGTTVALRGLPIGTTLVLLNGRRLENTGVSLQFTGDSFFDLNNIPVVIVKSIEVDENGSSAVYGSDALAGVVNIITKKNFTGLAISARYGWAKDMRVLRSSLAWGRRWSLGSLSVIGSYHKNDGLLNTERLLSASNDYIPFGGPDNNLPICSPGNVFSQNGAPLPGAPPGSGAPYAAVTGETETGRPALSQFTYGQLNECGLYTGMSLVPSTERESVLVQGHIRLTENIRAFTELMYSHVRQSFANGYQSLFGYPGNQEFTVSAANPYNPFGTTVGVAKSLPNVPVLLNFDTDFFRPLVGIKGTIVHRWHWEIAAWQSSDWTNNVERNLLPDAGAIQSALDSSNPATALNPFVKGPTGSATLLASLFTDGKIKLMGQTRSIETYIRGPIYRLPEGSIQTVLGGDYDRNTLYDNEINDGVDPQNTRYNFSQNHYDVFGEIRAPLIARHIDGKAVPLLATTIAGRYDHYRHVGGKETDQFSLEITPIDALTIRGTYATAFKAPPLFNLYEPTITSTAELRDPLTGQFVITKLAYGGNPNLRPMTGFSHSAGVVYMSNLVKGLSLSVTQWQVVERNAIQVLNQQVLVNSANLFPGRVIRDAAGNIVKIIDTVMNFGSLDVAGVDYRFKYGRHIGPGRMSININWTETYHYREALLPSVAAVEAVGKAQDDNTWAPRWKGVTAVNWTEGAFSGLIDAHYTSSYQDYDSTRLIGNFWIFDANLRWRLGRLLRREHDEFRHTYVEAGVTNLFNRRPQFSNYLYDFYGYDAAQMSIVGRSMYVGMSIHW